MNRELGQCLEQDTASFFSVIRLKKVEDFILLFWRNYDILYAEDEKEVQDREADTLCGYTSGFSHGIESPTGKGKRTKK